MHTETLTKLLNLTHYYVSDIISINNNEIHVKIKRKNKSRYFCTGCGHFHTRGFHSSYEVVIEDLSISGRRVFLHVDKKKFRCDNCKKILVAQEPEFFIRCTKRYANQVYRLTAITTNQEAGWYLGVDDEVIYRIDKKMLKFLAEKRLSPIPAALHLSIDEVSYKKYHRYLTNVIDTDKKMVIWNEKGRKTVVLNQYYQNIGADACEKIESVALGGAKTYISSTKKYAINAMIVYDHFHLIQKLNNAVDTVRKEQLNLARKADNTQLINLTKCKQRFILLKKKNKLTEHQKNYLNRLCILNEPIYKAMLLKESFLGIYEHKKEIDIKQYLENWLKDAAASGLPAFECLAISFKEKIEYILNWFRCKISSAISEGFNNKIKRLKRMAYGYKDIEYFKLKIHQHCGLLSPKLQNAL